MTTITREQVQKIIDTADEVITALAGTHEDICPESDNMLRLWDDLNDRYAPPEVVRELARIALASLEAEPVGTFRKGPCGYHPSFHEDAVPLFAAPPAPVSVPDYPENLPCPVMLEPGLRFGKGVTTKTMLGALRRRAEYYADLEAMTPEERAKHEANIEAFKAMLPQPTQRMPDMNGFLPCPFCNSPVKWCGENSADPDDEHLCHHIQCTNLECGADFDFINTGDDLLPDDPETIDAMTAAECLQPLRNVCLNRFNSRAAMLQGGNGGTNGKPLTITLPDIASKAFWSGTGKSETFHPETYKRWVKEAIERDCVITGIRVVVK